VIDLPRRLGPLFLVGVLTVLAGCGASDPSATAGEALEPTSPAMSTAASPAPVLPKVARKESRAGAKTTTQFWFDALTYAQQTGDLEPLESVSADECRLCTQHMTAIRGAFAGGGSVVGGGYTVREMTDEEYSDAIPLLNVVFDRDALSILGTGGATMQTVPASAFQSARVRLEYRSSRWRVAEISGLLPFGSAG
jgi:hypothetical protein